MAVTDYFELKIRVSRGDADTYRVLASGPTGEATGTFELPFDDRDIKIFVLSVGRRTRTATRSANAPELQRITEFGGKLFKALFQGRVGELYRVSKSVADSNGKALRVTLALTDVPALMHLPWEYLYDKPAFLSISKWTPVVRYLELSGTRPPLKVELPLRILAMVSSPRDAVELDVAAERERLTRALSGLHERGAVEVTWLENGTLPALLRELERGPFHVFHFIGHGEFDAQAGNGMLLLEDEAGLARRVTGTDLGVILENEPSFQLAVLNACEGARVSSDDPFAGVAASLVERQIPAVIAMQFEITDRAAIIFAGEFYWKLADGGTVDRALAFARQMIYADGNYIEWATPVLFMRVADGRIFDVPAAPVDHPPPAVDEPPTPVPEPDAEPDRVEPPPDDWWSRLRRRSPVVLAAGVVLGAALALAIGVAAARLIGSRGPPGSSWTLRGSIPAGVQNCSSSEDLYDVPGSLRPKTTRAGNRVRFTSSIACPGGAPGVTLVQYSLAATVADLEKYFDSRIPGAQPHGGSFKPGLCGAVTPAINNWRPRADAGHRPTLASGRGRMLCYVRTKEGSRDEARIEWTDRRLRVFGFAKGRNAATLFRWWKSAAGPTRRAAATS